MRYYFLCLAIFANLYVFSQNYNTELLANVRFPDECANIWGYAANGREYAIIGRSTGTSVFDVTDGRKPVLLQHIPGATSPWREIKSWKNRIYVVADRGSDGILIINMEKAPASMTFLFWKNPIKVDDKVLNIFKTDVINRAHDLYIDEKGYCYLTGSSFHNGVVTLDLNKNPDNPEFVNIFNPTYTHDAFARNDTFWAADIFAGEFSVWDLKEKSKPKKLASQRTGNAFTHNVWLSDDGKYAFTTDERANAFVESYQVNDLGNITFLDRYRSRTTQIRGTIPHNTYYHKGFLVTSYYTDGFTMVDASDPAHLMEVGAFDTYPAGDGDFHGCWGVYPYLPSGNILASDIEFGLFVIKPTYKKASYLKGLIKDSITGQPIADAVVKMQIIPFLEITSANDGTFKSGGPYTGPVQVTFSNPQYEAKTITVNLELGLTTTVDVLLKPLKAIGFKVTVIDAVTKQGIANAQLRWSRSGETKVIRMDDQGKSELQILEGLWEFYAGQWGYRYKMISAKQYNSDVNLTIELDRGYQDNFVFSFDWSANSSSAIVRGIWGLVEPRGAYIREKAINPEFDIPNDIGDQSMVTGNGSTIVTGDDVDGGFTQLISPNIDLATIAKPTFNFYAWTSRINTVDSLPRVGRLKVFLLSGADSITLDTINQNLSAWTEYHLTVDKSRIKDPSNVKIVFEAFEPQGADARNVVEFAIDGFSITDGISTSVLSKDPVLADLKIYPSIWTNQFTIQTTPYHADRKVQLIDQVGRLVHEAKLLKNDISLTVQPALPTGIYFVRLMKSNGEVGAALKVVKVE